MAVCFCVDLSVCVSLQEAELAARILLDQGQVTAWGQSQGGRRGAPLPQEREALQLPDSSLLPSLPVLSYPHLSPFLPFSLFRAP